MATIKFIPSADASVVSERSRQILRELLDSADCASCVITSTARTPASQARAMFTNIENSSVAAQKALYGAAGDQVIDEYQRLKPLGHRRQAILDAMEQTIIAIGPSKVSQHCGDPAKVNVIDIAPSSIANRDRFVAVLEAAIQRGQISRFFGPRNGDPAFHVEIVQ